MVKQSSDYGQLSEEMWTFLEEIYGGGPQLILKQSTATTSTGSASQASSTNQQASTTMPEVVTNDGTDTSSKSEVKT